MCLREWMSNMVFSLSLTLSHSLTLSLVSFCIGQIIRYNQMSSIHILVPTPSVPPTEEHVDDDEQAAPLALTWCCVYIVSSWKKRRSLPLPLSLCVSQFPSLPLPLSRSPSLSKTPQTFSPLVPQVVSHPSRIHHRSRSNVCNVSLLFMLFVFVFFW